MKKILLSIGCVAIILLCTVRIHAQTAQVSPVSNLQGNNAQVVNDNMQYLQNGVNSLVNLYSQLNSYFNNGVLSVANGGTGTSTPATAHGILLFISSDTITFATNEPIVLTILGAGGNGGNGGAWSSMPNQGGGGGGGAGGSLLTGFPFVVTANTTYNVTVGMTDGQPSSFDSVVVSGGANGSNGLSGAANGFGGNGGIAVSADSMSASLTSGGNSYISYVGYGNGANGGNGVTIAGSAYGGGGGGGPFGHGGNGGASGTTGSGGNGNNGGGFGAGGGGAGAPGSLGSSGTPGSGSQGFVLLQY